MPITASADPAWGSVLLDIDLSGSAGVWFITVTRTNNTTGAVDLVRSGDHIVAPGGFLAVYDLEAPLGTSVTYTAQAYTYLDVATGSPAQATVTSPDLSPLLAWVKSWDEPGASLPLQVSTVGFLPRKRKVARYDVIGRSNPVVHSFGLSGREGFIEVNALDWTTIDAVEELFAQDRLLIQFSPSLHIPDAFVAAGDMQPTVIGPRQGEAQKWRVDVTEMDRPSTEGWPLMAPGVTWESQATAFDSYTDAAAQFDSWSEYATQSAEASVVTGDVHGVDNGDGTITWTGTDVIDNGDGTYTLNGVTANGLNIFTV